MSTLQEIQTLVDDARAKIINGDPDAVQTITWPNIRTAINEYPELNRNGKMQLATLIHGRLDALGLEAGKQPVDINVERLTNLIKLKLANSNSQDSIPDWFPW